MSRYKEIHLAPSRDTCSDRLARSGLLDRPPDTLGDYGRPAPDRALRSHLAALAADPALPGPDLLSGHRTILAAAYVAVAACLFDLFILHRLLVPPRNVSYRPLEGARVHVGLTAWNDREVIGKAVREFKACPGVRKVIAVDNNSSDDTARVADEAGADEVIIETTPGYGSCCMRALAEASRDADVIIASFR
jgi:hypothetical protein